MPLLGRLGYLLPCHGGRAGAGCHDSWPVAARGADAAELALGARRACALRRNREHTRKCPGRLIWPARAFVLSPDAFYEGSVKCNTRITANMPSARAPISLRSFST